MKSRKKRSDGSLGIIEAIVGGVATGIGAFVGAVALGMFQGVSSAIHLFLTTHHLFW